MKIYNKLFAIIIAMLGVQTLSAQRDVTSLYINNAELSSLSGWTQTNFNNPARGNNTVGYATEAYAGWGSLEKTNYNLKQTITLPRGNYTLVNYSFFRYGLNYNTDSSKSLAFLKAGEQKVAIKTLGSIEAAGYAGSQAEGANCFDSKMYRNTLDFTIDTDGTSIEIGIEGTFDLKQSWCIVGMFELIDNDTEATMDAPFDVTGYITNPGFEYRNMAGWTLSSADVLGTQGNEQPFKRGQFYAEKWQQSGALTERSMSQSISGLPAGYYKLTANLGGSGTYIDLNGKTVEWTADNDYTTGYVLSEGEDLTITAGKKAEGSANWIHFENFRLYFCGDVNAALEIQIDKLSSYEAKLPSVKYAELEASVNAYDKDYNDIDELLQAISAIDALYANADALSAEYAKIEEYIEQAKVFDAEGVASYEADFNNGAYNAGDVERVRQELNVLTAEYVKTNFKNEIVVNEWTGSMGTARGQHWDGTTDGTTGTEYYDGNKWGGDSHSKTANVTLPEGTYVFKAAGRSHASATLTLTVGETVVTFNGKGDAGYGIDTDGNANFSEEGTYANNDNGRGWEWQFVKFTLDEETTVTLTANSNYNGITGAWASFANIGLWMDDATYLTANGDAINAPLAEAQALVNTKPMGADENAALVDAIALGEGTIETPAQLNAAIEALNNAVAEAKAWIAAYNEAKAPLVAAFERFEADYNDGANGPARAMTTDMWTTLLEAVKVAAVAKDETESYDGFAQAAKDFNDAMDAIDNAYAAEGLLQDMTHLIGNADCKANDAWPGSGRETSTGEHWSGDANRVYFVQNHENGAARTQTVTLPKTGTYYLKVAVRAVEAGSYVDIIINGKSNKTTGAHGRVGGTIATDGTEWESVDAGLEADKTFANDNKGYGWVYKHIYFNAEAGEATIALSLSDYRPENGNREANVGGMELYYVTIGDELILDENSTSIGGVEGWYKSVTVNRTIKANIWNTFVVPFDMEIPEGWEVMDLAETEMNGDVITMNFEDAESIEAGVPYMVRVKDQVSSINVEEVFVYEGMVGSATDHIAFIGVYESGKVPEGSFFISNNTFYRAADKTNTLKAFRAYLTPVNANVKSVGYTFGDDDFTAIEGVEDAESEVVAIYGADGALRTGLQKGLNIVKLSNGKVQKVLVK